MKSLSSNFINFFKSKSILDFVYLVIIILIVNLLNDMVVFMYHKIKNKQWSTNTFSKAKQSGEAVKLMEGFTGAGVIPTTCDVIPALTATSITSICDKLKFLLCNDNFEKLRRLLGGITTRSTDEYQFTINTHGGQIVTSGGDIKTGGINGTATSTSGGTIYTDRGDIITRGGDIITGSAVNSTGGGTIYTNRGNIVTNSGNITTGGLLDSTSGGGYINTARGEIKTNGGNIITGSITAPNINVTNLYAIGSDTNTREIFVKDHITLGGKILYVKHLQMINESEGEVFMDIRNKYGFVVARFIPPLTNSDYGQLVVWKNDNINYKYVALKDGTGIAD
jgi:hypothetical protein